MLWFLLTDYTKGLVYTSTTPHLNLTLDSGEALQFRKNNPNTHSFTIPNLYGKTYQFDFPVDLEIQQSTNPDSHPSSLLQAKGYKDITSQRYQKCLSFSNLWFLNDYTLWAHKQLTQYFRIYHSSLHNTYHIEPKNLTTPHSDPNALIHESNLTPHSDTGIFLLLKEYVLWYDRTAPLIYKPTRTATPKSFDIWSAYDIQLPSTRRPDLPTIHIPGNYTAALRYQLLNKALQDRNADPSHRKYQRSSLLQTWQADALLRMGKRTVLLVPRRCVHEDTLITLHDGSQKEAKFVTKDDVLLDNKRIISIHRNKTDSVKITLQNGMSIITSTDHRVPTSKNYHNTNWRDLNEDNYTFAKDIKLWDFLPISHTLPNTVPHPERNSKDFGEGLAFWLLLGDWCRGVKLIAVHDDALRNHITSSFDQCGIKYIIPQSQYIRVSTKNSFINQLPEINELSYNKYIDPSRFSRSSDRKWGVLEWLLLTDGYIQKNKIGIEYCSTSEKLIDAIQKLCLDLGIFTTKHTKFIKSNFNSSTNNIAYTLYITSSSEILRVFDSINISCKKNYENQLSLILSHKNSNSINNVIPLHAFSQADKSLAQNVKVKWNRRRLRWEDQIRDPEYNFQRRKVHNYGLQGRLKYFWSPVVSVELLPEQQDTIDFEVTGDHTFVANNIVTHNSGKTSLFALEILKEMLNTNYRSGTRPRTVLFISKDYDAVDQVMDYIQSLLNDFDWLKHMFHYDQVNHVFSLRTYDDSPQPKQVTIAQCRFLSALGKLPGVGSAADAVFFDEAMYIPTPVMENLMKIVDHEGARLLVMSTFYDDRPGQQLYYRPVDLCNKYEQQSSQINDPFQHTVDLYLKHRHNTTDSTYTLPDESVWLRYTIDDVDVIINKQHAKEALLDNPDSYMRQLYCRMLEKKTVFSYKHSLITSRFSNATVSTPHPHYLLGEWDQQFSYIPNRKRIVTAYDPALTWDMSAWLDSAYDQTRNKIVVFKEMNLNYQNKSSFIPQANIIKEHISSYLSSFKVPILKSMDASHPGVSDAMAWQWVHFQYYYRWVWGNALDAKKDANKPNTWKVPKRLMVEATQMLFDNNMIEIRSNQCPTLTQQLSTFQQYTNRETGSTKYDASSSNHDDFVATLLMVCRTWRNHLWLSRNKFEAPDEDSSHTSTQLDNTPLPIGAIPNPYLSQQDSPVAPRYENIDIWFYY